jgi:hypothetical protein
MAEASKKTEQLALQIISVSSDANDVADCMPS